MKILYNGKEIRYKTTGKIIECFTDYGETVSWEIHKSLNRIRKIVVLNFSPMRVVMIGKQIEILRSNINVNGIMKNLSISEIRRDFKYLYAGTLGSKIMILAESSAGSVAIINIDNDSNAESCIVHPKEKLEFFDANPYSEGDGCMLCSGKSDGRDCEFAISTDAIRVDKK